MSAAMVGAEWCRVMARYNSWQNRGLAALFEEADEAALWRDRGAFFGSILGTANHLLWGDGVWMARFADMPAPGTGIAGSPRLTESRTAWAERREATDAAIEGWADGLSDDDLGGGLSWHSGALGRDVTRPRALCVAHFFNHQTHHRGQIHAMLTAAGHRPGDTDLFAMPGLG